MKLIAIFIVFFGLSWECGGMDSQPPLFLLLVFPLIKKKSDVRSEGCYWKSLNYLFIEFRWQLRDHTESY